MQQLQSWHNTSTQRSQHLLQASLLTWNLEWANSTDSKEDLKGPLCSSTILQWDSPTFWWFSLKSGRPKTLYMYKPYPRSSRTSGRTDSCWVWRSGLIVEQRQWWRPHCSLDSQQPTSSRLQKAPTDWTDRPEWLCRTAGQQWTEGRLSGQEEGGWSLETHEGQSAHHLEWYQRKQHNTLLVVMTVKSFEDLKSD